LPQGKNQKRSPAWLHEGGVNWRSWGEPYRAICNCSATLWQNVTLTLISPTSEIFHQPKKHSYAMSKGSYILYYKFPIPQIKIYR